MNRNKDCFLAAECVYVGVTGQHCLKVYSM